MSLAVLLATHNGVRFVESQLASIRGQTLQPDLILIVDDGSIDGSVERCEMFREQSTIEVRIVSLNRVDPPVDLYSRIASVFLAGIRYLEAYDFVAFADQDDIWLPHHLEALQAALIANPFACYAFSDACFIDADGKRVPGTLFRRYRVPKGFNEKSSLGQMWCLLRAPRVTGSTMMTRGDLVAKLAPIPIGVLHDRWVSLAGAVSGKGVAVTEILTQYRCHDAQAVGVRRGTAMQRAALMLSRWSDQRVALAELSAIKEFAGRFGNSGVRGVYAAIACRRIQLLLQKWFAAVVSVGAHAGGLTGA